MSAPRGNDFAAKSPSERADSFLHIRCRRADKASWVRAAQERAKRDPEASPALAAWVVDRLNAAAEPRS